MTYLVQAHSVSGAVKHVEEVMSSTMIDYEIVGIAETKIWMSSNIVLVRRTTRTRSLNTRNKGIRI